VDVVRGLLDTSVIVGRSRPPLDEAAISAVTLAELHYGVLRARTDGERAVRLRRLALVESEFDPLPIDGDVARVYGAIVAGARAAGKRPRTADALIAATAAAHGLTVYTRDADFAGLPGVDVIVVAGDSG
jgi:predicted nucleic acid-binding protein